MNMTRLQVFHEAAESLSFSKAAARLNITQPAVSAQIRNLVKLFTRLGKKIVLTEAGTVLRGYARKIFRLRNEAEEVMNDLRLVRRGTLKVGTTHTYAGHIMPPILSRFQTAFPQVTVVLHEGSSMEISRQLASLDIEVAVVAYPGSVKKVRFDFLKREGLAVIVAPDHPLANKKSVPVKALADENLVMREKGSGTYRVVEELFRKYRLSPRVIFEASNAEVIKQQVAGGAGISFLTKSSVQQDLAEGRLATLTLKKEPLNLDIHIAVRQGHELSQPAQAFVDLLSEK
jgi:LysR family transcriptional regulator, low CO2-responsive transcriptional regulator